MGLGLWVSGFIGLRQSYPAFTIEERQAYPNLDAPSKTNSWCLFGLFPIRVHVPS